MTDAEKSSYRAAAAALRHDGLITVKPAAPTKPPMPKLREPEPFIAPDELKAANDRHDREHGNPLVWMRSRVRSSWCRGRAWR